MNRTVKFLFLGFLLCILSISSGCGSGEPTGFVSGNVTLKNGNDPAGLLIRFMNPSNGKGATALVQNDGTYALKYKGDTGIPVGTYNIAITAQVKHLNDLEMIEFMKLSGAEQRKIEAERNAKRALVPSKFRTTETSDLSYEIVDGVQTHNIVIPE